MMRFLIFVFLLFILCSSMLHPATITFNDNQNKDVLFIDSQNLNQIHLEFNLSDFQLEKGDQNVLYDSVYCSDLITLPGDESSLLPYFSCLLGIPERGETDIIITASKSEQYEDINLKADNITVNPELIRISEPLIFRDLRVVSLMIQPFQYNSTSKELAVTNNINFEIITEGESGINQKEKANKMSRIFEPIYELAVTNYRDLERTEYQSPSYMLIYPEANMIETDLEPLLNWKHKKGYNVTAVCTSEIGTSLEDIKNYIQNAYDTWTDPPELVCLIGDALGSYTIPATFMEGGEGDHYYSLLEGDDILADVIIGRISVESRTQLQTVVNKICSYERTPYLDEPDWISNVLLSADPSYSSPATVNTCLSIKDMILNNNPDFTFDEVYSPPFPNFMNNSLNNGAGYFVYRGQGGMNGWEPEYHNNGHKLYNAVIITCSTGDYYYNTCTSEALLRLGTPYSPNGAVSAIGTTGPHTHTSFNNIVAAGIFDALFNQNIQSIGGALVWGKLLMYMNYPLNPSNHVTQFCYWNNLMGDPGLIPWTAFPEYLTVTHEEQIALGTNYIEVTVMDAYEHPLEGAWVTALMGEDAIFSTDFTDENGMVILPIENTVTGTVDLTVTIHDHIPYEGSFEIVQSVHSINILEYVIDDDNLGTSSGNGDGLINPGETIELSVGLQNSGSVTAEDISAQISSEQSWINIIDGVESYGNILPGSMTFSDDDFDIAVGSSALEGNEIRLDLSIAEGQHVNYQDHIYLTVNGPYLDVCSYLVDDNSNNQLDPGEIADLVLTLENSGSISVDDVWGIISCQENLISFEDDSGYFGTILPDNQIDNLNDVFNLNANSQILPGSQFVIDLNLFNSNGFEQEIEFILEVGTVTVNDPLGPDQYGYYCYDDDDAGYYNAPVYEWIEIDPEYGGNGIDLNFSDWGNEGDIATIDLPFIFNFYGAGYDEITVCSNGWICPGVTEQGAFMNWQLPGPLGPSPMVAPFWDDLIISDGDVFYFYEEAFHYVIIEWSRVYNEYDNSEETFQVLLYDPIYYPTFTGDSEIKFQYMTVNNVDQGHYGSAHNDHGQFATVGIEDHTASQGLSYTYNNQYPAAAKVLENEMALLFTGPFIAPEEPFLVLGEMILIDENGNGAADYGENIDLQIMLNNMGESSATDIFASLYTEDPFITLNQDYSEYEDITAGSSQSCLTNFNIDVNSNCPDDHNAVFTINVTCSENSWEYYFSVNLNAPLPEIQSVMVLNDDNLDGILDPGEAADLHIQLVNSGGADIWTALLNLSSNDQYVMISNNTIPLDILESLDGVNVVFGIVVSPEAEVGHIIPFELALDADLGVNELFSFTVNVGQGFALEFDGIDDYCLIPNSTSLNVTTNQLTLEMWVKLFELPSQIDDGDAGIYDSENDSYVLYLDRSQEELRFKVRVQNGDYERPGIHQSDLSLNTWHHITGVYDGNINEAMIYLDGELKDTHYDNDLYGPVDPGQIASLGSEAGNYYFFNGMIDEVRIWDTAKTQIEIQNAMYSSLSGNEENLVAYWKLDEGNGSTIFDYTSNNNDGDIIEATWTAGVILNGLYPPRDLRAEIDDQTVILDWEEPLMTDNLYGYNVYRNDELLNSELTTELIFTDPDLPYESFTYYVTAVYHDNNESIPSNEVEIFISEYGYALEFDSSDDMVVVNDSPSLDVNHITIETWLKLSSGSESAIRKHNAYLIEMDNERVEFRIRTDGWSSVVESSFDLDYDTWYHIAGTYDGSVMILYVNGVFEENAAESGLINSSDNELYIGNWGEVFHGSLDEIRIWDHARTEVEINSTMYCPLDGNETGLVAYWPMNAGSGNMIFDYTDNGNDGSVSGASWVPGYVLTGYNPPWGLGAQITDNTVSLVWEEPYNNDDFTGYNIYRNDVQINTELITENSYIDGDLPFSTYNYFVTAVYEEDQESGPSNEVYVCLSETGTALEFDGYNDFVSMGDNDIIDFNDIDFSVCAWVKTSSESIGTIINKGPNGQFGSGVPRWHIQVLADGAINAYIEDAEGDNQDGGTNNQTWHSTATLNDGNWHFVSVVYRLTGGISSIYVDGIAQPDTRDLSVVDNTSNGNNLIFGYRREGSPTQYFNGNIDEVRIWNTALTQENILSQMYAPLSGDENGLTSYWKMDEGTGNTIYDHTSSNNNGTIYGANWTEGYMLTGFCPPWNLYAEFEENTIILNWNPPVIGEGLVGYNIYRNTESINIEPVTEISYIDNELPWGTYTYHVTAVYEENQESGFSNEVEVCISESGTALYFDGNNDHVFLGNWGDYSDNITVEAWIKSEGSEDWDNIICGPPGDIIFTINDNLLNFAGQNGYPIYHNTWSTTPLNDGLWHHVAGTYDGSQVCVYVDGILEASNPANGIFSPGVKQIGSSGNGDYEFFNGTIDELRIWDIALTEEQVFAYMYTPIWNRRID